MNTRSNKVLSGYILEETTEMSLSELCEHCRLPTESMLELVEYGIITPCRGKVSHQWRFHSESLMRADKALRLQRDLHVNLAGVALALELLDEINELKALLTHTSYINSS